MERIIVTGANGFIGRHLVEYLSKQSDIGKIYALGRTNKGYFNHLSNKIEFIEIDINNIDNLKIKNTVDTIFHLAWVGVSGENRLDYMKQNKNIELTMNLLKWAKRNNITKFITAGSIMEKEVIKSTYYSNIKLSKNFTYGVAKISTHVNCSILADELGITYIQPLITNTYGPLENSKRLINTVIRKVLTNQSPELTDGQQNYDFIYIEDLCQALYLIGKYGVNREEYTIGSGNSFTLKNWLIQLRKILNTDIDFEFGTIPFYGVSLDKKDFSIDNLVNLGFNPKYTFEEGIEETVKWIEENL